MHKKIAVLVTYDFEDAEYAEPVEAFRAARHSIINHDSQAGKIIYGKKRQAFVTIDESIDDASVHDFDALLIPGGFRQINCAKMNAISYLSGTLQTCKNPFYAVLMHPKF